MITSRIIQAAILATLATACAPRPAAPPRPDEAAIRTALSAELAKIGPAFAAKNAAALADLFTEDATWILPDASSFTGRANIVSAANGFFGSYQSFVIEQMTIDRLVVVSDSEAVTFSHGTYTMTVRGKAPERRVNPFADHWRKGPDGAWRVTYEVNADGPAPAAAAATP